MVNKKTLILIAAFFILLIFLYYNRKNILMWISGFIVLIISFLNIQRKENLENINITQEGGVVLKYFNKGENRFTFDYENVIKVPEVTTMVFIDNNLLVTTKPGILKLIKNNIIEEEDLLDLKIDEPYFTNEGMEQGLLGLAYNSSSNLIYLCFCTTSQDENYIMDLVVNEYSLDPINFNVKKNKNIITIPYKNDYHHGGTIIYKNNSLYLSTGDGGPQGDPDMSSQNINNYYGKILKINLEDDNHIKNIAIGLRNPWKFSIDSQDRMFIGDVGWNQAEEVDLIQDINKNKIYNFGWSYFEGSVRLKLSKKFKDFDPPVFEYPTSDRFGRSVIGGYFLNNYNIYLFADYLGFIKAIEFNDTNWIQVGNEKLFSDEIIYTLGYDGVDIFIGTNKRLLKLIINK